MLDVSAPQGSTPGAETAESAHLTSDAVPRPLYAHGAVWAITELAQKQGNSLSSI